MLIGNFSHTAVTKTEISVVICTYNRHALLKETLTSLVRQEVKNIKHEVIVVDNNSTDRTKEVVEDFQRRQPHVFRYAFEPKQGLSHARNRGVAEARGEVIAFTDDDVIVDKNWLQNIWQHFQNDPSLACLGGKILPRWETSPPRWLTTELWGPLALLDRGNEVLVLNDVRIWGANFAVRATMFEKYGGFDPRWGRVRGKLYGGEETRFLEQLLGTGEKIIYAPDVVAWHFIPRERMTKRYFRRWLFNYGELEAIQTRCLSHRNIMGIPFYRFRFLLKNVGHLLRHPSFKNELKLMYQLGFIYGRIKAKRRKR